MRLHKVFTIAKRDYIATVCSLLLYLAFVIPIDLWLTAKSGLPVNYGFVGNVPYGPLDFLGPWPFRVFKVSCGVCLLLAVMTAPWTIVQFIVRKRMRGHRLVAKTSSLAQPETRDELPLEVPPAGEPHLG